jgi:four helix bundle protein
MQNNLKERTKRFALDAIRFCSSLPSKPEFRVVTGQLLRSATSVGANYRAACRSKSKADFINKLSIVEEEADESEYWLELLENLSAGNMAELRRLKDEASQLVAIMVQSKKTARASAVSGDSQLATRNSKIS